MQNSYRDIKGNLLFFFNMPSIKLHKNLRSHITFHKCPKWRRVHFWARKLAFFRLRNEWLLKCIFHNWSAQEIFFFDEKINTIPSVCYVGNLIYCHWMNGRTFTSIKRHPFSNFNQIVFFHLCPRMTFQIISASFLLMFKKEHVIWGLFSLPHSCALPMVRQWLWLTKANSVWTSFCEIEATCRRREKKDYIFDTFHGRFFKLMLGYERSILSSESFK